MSQNHAESSSGPFDLVVVGAGPGGYVAAIRAAQLGLKVACVEKQYLGGTCLNVGCIPSKALLDSSERFHSAAHDLASRGITVGDMKFDLSGMMKFKDDAVKKLTGGVGMLFRKNKVTHLAGHGRLAGPGRVSVTADDDKTLTVEAKNILLAPGSVPNTVPGLTFDGKHVLSSTEALSLDKVPGTLVVVGGGYIGVEIGSVWNRLGSRVVVIEYADRILPAGDKESAGALHKLLAKQGLEFHLGHAVASAEVKGKKVKVVAKSNAGGDDKTFEADKVLVAVGRKPATKDLGLETVGVAPDGRGFIEVDDGFRVKGLDHVYAIGDAIGRIMLAHNAEHEGKAVAEFLGSGTRPHVNYGACPAVVYTHPELASVGLTEEAARQKYGADLKIGRFPLAANGRARGMGEIDGFVKVIGHAKTDRLLGVHILAPHASDMVGEATLAMEFAASVEDVARAYHAHPTLPEAIKEAAMAADGHAIHM